MLIKDLCQEFLSNYSIIIDPNNFSENFKSELETSDFRKRLIHITSFMLPGVNSIIKDEDYLPEQLVARAIEYVSKINDSFKIKTIDDLGKISAIKEVDKLKDLIQEVNDSFRVSVDYHSSSNPKLNFFHVFHYLSHWGVKSNKQPDIELPDFNKMVSDEVDAKTTEFEQVYLKALEDGKSITELNKLIKQQSKKLINRNYAESFRKQATKHNWISFGWLGAGILSIGLFIYLIFCAEIYNNLKTQDVINGVAVYNITNIVLKVAIISLQIFFISFAFKQFSVNRHLCTVNKHRANAFDSYEFFAAATKDDTESQKTLMLQLAKAIYEQSSTGYLSGGKDNVNPSILEITNMFKGANG
ncbi:MAG: hypothetical protein HQ522_16670 [Bacteroidetes bacterium]|nr:hypothetical protein [Bacteroidota bacterium]